MRLDRWITGLADRLVAVDVAGTTAYVLDEDVDSLASAMPSEAVRFLPGHDQWVMGPGTKDEHVVPPARRTPVTRKANLVVAGGVVSGTWSATGGEVRVTWFGEHANPQRKALEAEIASLATFLAGR